MKTLIVATDFSIESENAVEYAGAAAKHLSTDVVLFNSFSIPTHVSNGRLPASVFKELLINNRLLLKQRAADLSEKYAIKVEYESGFLQLTDDLETLFSKYKAAMIIIGTSAQSLGQDLFANSHTTSILKLKFPILSIPLNTVFKPVKSILFACDVVRGINAKILQDVRHFAQIMGAEVEVFHVQNKLKSAEESTRLEHLTDQVNQALEGIPHSYMPRESNFVIDEIKNETNRINADLLIMIPQRYGFWQSLIHRSKTRIMASLSEIPLLSIRIE